MDQGAEFPITVTYHRDGNAWTFETPVPFENATRFRITQLSCRRDGETSSRPCSSADTVEVRPAAPETSGPGARR